MVIWMRDLCARPAETQSQDATADARRRREDERPRRPLSWCFKGAFIPAPCSLRHEEDRSDARSRARQAWTAADVRHFCVSFSRGVILVIWTAKAPQKTKMSKERAPKQLGRVAKRLLHRLKKD